jgi:subtilisin family serine protease
MTAAAWLRNGAAALAWAALAALASCASPPDASAPVQRAAAADDGDDLIIVAIAEHLSSAPAVGGSARGDYRRGSYFGSHDARATAAAIAGEQGMTEVAAWTIEPLALRCMLYRLRAGTDRQAALAALRRDPRVRLAQPSNRFETYTEPPPYNDPYVGLQHSLSGMGAFAAQQWGQGQNITVAVIDSAVDATHPELAERVHQQRDFVRGGAATASDGHGTAVAGVIAATANNHQGIVGVAPRASLLALRACWPAAAGARCNTFTLAQALAAAIAAGADVINLSLGGPRDALLEQLVAYAVSRGAVVVGALPPSGRVEGFPAAATGVLVAAVTAPRSATAPGTLAAPGHQVLTLTPGGGYGYSSGSSIAAAHVSGAIALLKSIRPQLGAAEATKLLGAGATELNLCTAARALAAGSDVAAC